VKRLIIPAVLAAVLLPAGASAAQLPAAIPGQHHGCTTPKEPAGTPIHVDPATGNATVATSWAGTTYVCEFGQWRSV